MIASEGRAFLVGRNGLVHDGLRLRDQCGTSQSGALLRLRSVAEIGRAALYIKLKSCAHCTTNDDLVEFWRKYAANGV